jgi:hypothetical protein
LLTCVPTVTTMLPVDVPIGTVAVMLVSLHLLAVAVVALNFTVLVPCMAPKFVPVMITEVAMAPELGFEPVIVTVGGVIGGAVGVDGELAKPQPATHHKARHASPARCFNPDKTFPLARLRVLLRDTRARIAS